MAQAPQPERSPLRSFRFAESSIELIENNELIPDGLVMSLLQDDKGLIWIGTQSGLLRYDGYRFRHYTNDPRNPSSLCGDYVQTMALDPKGQIWAASQNEGLSRYDPTRDCFVNYKHIPGDPNSLLEGRIQALACDAKGGTWVGLKSGLSYLKPNSSSFVHLQHDPSNPRSLADSDVQAILFDRGGKLWVGTSKGLQVFEAQGFAQVASFEEEPNSLAGKEVCSLFEARDGKIWLGTLEHGVAWLDPKRLASGPNWAIPQDKSLVRKILQPNPDEIWVSTYGNGILVLAALDGSLMQHLRQDPTTPGTLASDHIGAMLTTRSGLLFVGNWGGGLQRYNVRNQAIRLLRSNPLRPGSLSQANCAAILELRDGRILIGTATNGIDIYDRERGLIGGYRPDANRPGFLISGDIRALAETPDGSLWASTPIGIHRKRPNEKWQRYGAAEGLHGFTINRFLIRKDGSLWAGTSNGLIRWHEEQGRFEILKSLDGSPMQASVTPMAEDDEGRLWLGTGVGLWVLEPGKNRLRLASNVMQGKGGLSSNNVNGLLFDSKGRLWADTSFGLDRLVRWDGSRAVFEHISEKLGRTGLAFDSNLLEDPLGRIWTPRFMLEPEELKLHELGKAEGMAIGTPWLGSFCQTRDGLLLFGGSEGLAVIDPMRFEDWEEQPAVVATELKIDGTGQPLSALEPELVLQPGQHLFSIEFAALDYSAPQKLRYAYRLLDEHVNWIETDAEHRIAAFGNLWPGNYRLEVRGTNRNGVVSPHELHLKIRILPVFWQTKWFVLFLIAALIGGIFAFNRWNLKRLHNKANQLQKLVAARTTDILNLSQIGRELTATLDMEQAFLRVHKQIEARLDAQLFNIGLYEELQERILFVYGIENGSRLPHSVCPMSDQNHPAVWSVRERSELIAHTRDELFSFVGMAFEEQRVETMVCLPLLAQGKVIGCLTVQNSEPRAYDPDQLEFLRVMASYAAISLANANAHSKIKEAHKRLQESQNQLVFQEKMASLGTLTAGIAHELSNPLNFIINLSPVTQELTAELVETARKEQPFPDAAARGDFVEAVKNVETNVGIILKHGRRASQIVSAMLEMVRKSDSQKSLYDWNGFVEKYVNIDYQSEFATDMGSKPLLHFELDPEVGKVRIKPQNMGRVIISLVNNAIYAIRAKAEQAHKNPDMEAYRGKLEIRTKRLDAFALLEIWDNGTGIEKENLKKVLTPFFTTKPTGYGNIGLGLSVAFEIVVQEHGGELSIESEPSQWTCVRVSLPRES